MFTPPPAIDPGATGSRAARPPSGAEPAAPGIDETFAALKSTRIGLSAAEAAARLTSARQRRSAARTRIPRPKWPHAVNILASRAFAQVADPVHLLLLSCGLAAATLGAPAMAVAIVVLTSLRVMLLAAIETRHDQVRSELRQARAPRVRVRRDGAVSTIAAADVVPGDVVELAAGSRVPADLRLFELDALVIDRTPVQGNTAMAWADSWVTRGRGAGIVTAAGPDAVGAALSRLDVRGIDSDDTLPDDAGSVASDAAPASTPLSVRIDRANAVVLGTAVVVLLAGMLRGSGKLHAVLAAVVLAAMAWSARARLAEPLKRLAAVQGARRLMAAGVFVRDIDGVDRLASLPADGEASLRRAIAVTIAGTDDTDRARESADVVFNAPASDIPRLAATATRTARNAAAGAERALAFGMPSAVALLLATALLAIALVPSWPASVPLGLHLLLFAWCITLALTSTRSGAVRAPEPLDPRTVDAVWVIALAAASLAAARLAAHFGVDSATFALATFAFGCAAFTWVVASEFGQGGWALRRPLLDRPRDAAWLALGTLTGLAASVAAVHVPRWQSAFETAALSAATWGIAGGLAVVAVAALLATMFALQWMQRRSARAASRTMATADAATPTCADSVAASEPARSSDAPPSTAQAPR